LTYSKKICYNLTAMEWSRHAVDDQSNRERHTMEAAMMEAATAEATPVASRQRRPSLREQLAAVREQLEQSTSSLATVTAERDSARREVVEITHDLALEMGETGYLRDRLSQVRDALFETEEKGSDLSVMVGQHQETIEDVRHVAAALALLIASRGNAPQVVTESFVGAVNKIGPPSQGTIDEFETAMTRAYAVEVQNAVKNVRLVDQSQRTSGARPAGFPSGFVDFLESLGARVIGADELDPSRYVGAGY
jgi:hypothetical protein